MITKKQIESALILRGIHKEFILEFSKDGSFLGCFANEKNNGWKIEERRISYSTSSFESDIPLSNWTLFSYPWETKLGGQCHEELFEIFKELGFTKSFEGLKGITLYLTLSK